MIEKIFQVSERGSNLKTEVVAGTTTFLTMAYIIFVQPAVLSAAGMDAGSVFVATCLASAIGTIMMGVLANYPFAQAPGMGHNFFFAFAAIPLISGFLGNDTSVEPWQVGMGAIFISGSLFLVLSFTNLIQSIIKAMPETLKHAIAVGIGLLISLIGLQWGGLVVDAPGTLLTLGNIKSTPVLLTISGVFVIAIMMARGIKGAIIFGTLITGVAGIITGLTHFEGVFSLPPSLQPTMFKLSFSHLLTLQAVPLILTFFILDFFDTVGTLVGIGDKAGFIQKDGSLPKSEKALAADAIGTVSGALLGTSTVTSYIESAAGVAEGGRTGLSNLVTGMWFLLALFMAPLVSMVGKVVPYEMHLADGRTLQLQLYPIVAPVLIIIGSVMMSSVRKIEWNDMSEAIPAFLCIVMMPFSGFSITEGIAFGFISYTVLKLFTGRGKELHWLVYGLAGLFLLKYIFV